MPKQTKEYFSHDYDSSHDLEMTAMVGELKAEGYGIFWRTVEMMHKEGGYLPLSAITFKSIAKSLEIDPDVVKKVIERCISEFNLFFEKNKKFSSRRVLKNLKDRAKIRKIKSEAGKASAKKRAEAGGVQQNSTGVEQNPTKKRKGKERKEKESNKSLLLRDQPFIESLQNSWRVSFEDVKKMVEDFDLWLIAQAKIHKTYIGYRSHFHNWGKQQYKEYQSSIPQITMVY